MLTVLMKKRQKKNLTKTTGNTMSQSRTKTGIQNKTKKKPEGQTREVEELKRK